MNRIEPLHKPKEFRASTTVFTKSNAHMPAGIVLPDGCMFAILIRGCTPVLHSLEGQGMYEVDCPDNPHDKWPIAVCTIDRAHEKAWAALSAAEVDRILDRCARAVERRVAGMPIRNGDA